MRKKSLYLMFVMLVVLSMTLAACGAQAVPTLPEYCRFSTVRNSQVKILSVSNNAEGQSSVILREGGQITTMLISGTGSYSISRMGQILSTGTFATGSSVSIGGITVGKWIGVGVDPISDCSSQ